jgi:hypothetical protein
MVTAGPIGMAWTRGWRLRKSATPGLRRIEFVPKEIVK